MGYAFETTTEDIMTAAKQLGVTISEESAEALMNEIDTDMVERAALKADCSFDEDDMEGDMQEQTDAAMEEIRTQLQENQYFLSLK